MKLLLTLSALCVLSCAKDIGAGVGAKADISSSVAYTGAGRVCDDHSCPMPACPGDMVEIKGKWCPQVEQICLHWVDANGNRMPDPPPGSSGRCGEWKSPARCLTPESQRPTKHYCIDKYEYPNVKDARPRSWMTWYDAKKEFESLNKRLCTDSEWAMACEGPDWHPYPYGDGYHRDKTACNFDNSGKGYDVFKATSPDTEIARRLDALLVPSGSMPRCVSPYGVYDMVGNIDEFTVNESGKPYVSSLRGGHVFGVRNFCRPATTAHGPNFKWYETGSRGCRDVYRP